MPQTSEREMNNKQGQSNANLSDEVLYKIEVPANRYDLLCIEGLVLALRTYLSLSPPPTYTYTYTHPPLTITQLPSLLDLQDKLHQNIGRRRTLVAIGTHNLDALTPPFTYEALPPKDITFQPLGEERTYTVDALFEHYREKNSHLLPYLSITDTSPLHPVIFDAQRAVLSLPPIINSERSKLTPNTQNVLIECTGTDSTKLTIVLQTIVAMFGPYCEQIEAVQVVNSAGHASIPPSLQPSHFTASVDYINRGIGVNLSPAEMIALLARMSLHATYDTAHHALNVAAPITRTDILHACDIMEDVAIAHGYNNIPKTIPLTSTIGKQLLINKLSDEVRGVMAQAGWTEVLTWALVSKQDNFVSMRAEPDSVPAVLIHNPKTVEFELVRTSLLPGLLKALSSNRGRVALPVRVFEVGDIVLTDVCTDVGAHNERKVAALYCGVTSGFELIHGLVDKMMQQAGLEFDRYRLEPSDHARFLSGRQANVVMTDGGAVVGSFGLIHPEVLQAFDLKYPCSALEMDVSRLMMV